MRSESTECTAHLLPVTLSITAAVVRAFKLRIFACSHYRFLTSTNRRDRQVGSKEKIVSERERAREL